MRKYVDLIEYTKLGMVPSVICILLEAQKEERLSEVINEKDENGDTAAIWAAHYHNIEILRRLIVAGADLTVISSNGMTALAYAQSHKDESMITLIKENLITG